MLDLLPFPSKLSVHSETMLQVYIETTTVEKLLRMLITLFWQLDMESKVELNSGILKIHGVPTGEIKDISKWKDKLTCVLLLNVTLILWLTRQVSNKLANND